MEGWDHDPNDQTKIRYYFSFFASKKYYDNGDKQIKYKETDSNGNPTKSQYIVSFPLNKKIYTRLIPRTYTRLSKIPEEKAKHMISRKSEFERLTMKLKDDEQKLDDDRKKYQADEDNYYNYTNKPNFTGVLKSKETLYDDKIKIRNAQEDLRRFRNYFEIASRTWN